jgi:hypothetical protein
MSPVVSPSAEKIRRGLLTATHEQELTATQKTRKACKQALQYTLANRSSSSCTIAKAYNTKPDSWHHQ